MESFKACEIAIDFYTTRAREKDEIFPWDFIDIGVTRDFLYQEYENSLKETTTPNCRAKCSNCGALQYKGGVCLENKN